MLPFVELIKLILSQLGAAFFGWLRDPSYLYYPVMLLIVFSLVYRQFRRQAKLEIHLFGVPFSNPWRQFFISLGFGLIGGIFVSLVMVFLGIPLSEELGLIYVWPIALTLMLIHPRFMCFAYGGGVVGVISLVVRGLGALFPGLGDVSFFASLMAVDLAALMGLVGVLHLAESLLIFLSGHIGASPILLKNPRGELVGGFMLQRFWPLPITALMVELVKIGELVGDGVPMPDWWPLLQPYLTVTAGMTLTYFLLPIVAALGYSDFAVSTAPKSKSRQSAGYLAAYSLVLISISMLSAHLRFLQFLPVLFAPLAHEFVIYVGNRREWARPPLYTPAPEGVRLLTVLPESAAKEKGLGGGWLITNVNGFTTNNRRQLTDALEALPGLAEIEAVSPEGMTRTFLIHRREGPLGLIPVPDASEETNILTLGGKGFLLRFWERYKARRKKL